MNAQNGGQPQNSNNKQPGLSWSAPQKPVMPAAVPAAKVVAPVAKPVVSAVAAPNRSAAKIAGWLAAGVVAGVVLAWGGTAIMNRGATPAAGSSAQNTSLTAQTTDTTTTTISSTLSIPTPQKAGTSVEVAQVAVSVPTWVVVYESRDGKPGNVLGAGLFSASQQSGTVELLRSTLAGQSYFVAEQTDNGDRRFSLKDDALVTEGGQTAWVTFTAN